MKLEVHKLSKFTIFRIYFIGIGVSAFTLTMLCGLAAFFGAETVNWNGEQITGISALLYGPLIGFMITAFTSIVCWLFSIFGLWLYSFYKPLIIEFTETESIQQNNK